MKKAFVAFLLIALVCVSTFARPYGSEVWNMEAWGVGASVSLSTSSTKAVSADGMEVFGFVRGYNPWLEDKFDGLEERIKLGYTFSFNDNPSVSGLYLDTAFIYKITPYDIGSSDQALFFFAEGGLSSDFHVVNGSYKLNLGLTAGFSGKMFIAETNESSVGAFATGRFNVINSTGFNRFSIQTGSFFDRNLGTH